MAMDLSVKSYSNAPEYMIADANIPIVTATKTAAQALQKGAPVLLKESGKVDKVTDTADATNMERMYGIVAEDVAANEDAIVYLTGSFFAQALALESNVSAEALEMPMRRLGIFLV